MIETDADCGVQHSAWRNAALPPEVLSTLLPGDHSAEAAAQTPSIPMSHVPNDRPVRDPGQKGETEPH
ncbi:hypothetical protein OG887_02890 [Streptomyces sp. NBC_00053]|uniref:hypothetical protein n=1 Tax=unclassified Streptomyces TaxID=2593676 RepID=UPI000F5BBC62|nr:MULTISPECIES: hypothetical protein [unclassified Streptomyces]MCX5098506.1 hypothetical protein [Streptomyces sp. NBC_00439]MCX5498359.1 hypothetical protein [Streptomyces sp. NBC_00052]MCX5553109.1 hypothetical protein [Streptomyces sp. NBC_00051]WSW99458.1 hypothetical protein OG355_02940 [Streptomyces sp. NBC_00987]